MILVLCETCSLAVLLCGLWPPLLIIKKAPVFTDASAKTTYNCKYNGRLKRTVKTLLNFIYNCFFNVAVASVDCVYFGSIVLLSFYNYV